MARSFIFAAFVLIFALCSFRSNGIDATTLTYTSSSNLNIVDYSTITDSIYVPESFSPAEVAVTVNIFHTYQGDLIVKVKHGDQTVSLFDRKTTCRSTDNVHVTFKDSAPASFQTSCASSGTFRPKDLLSSFSNATVNGQWNLTITDVYGGDHGRLANWSISLTPKAPTVTPSNTNVPKSNAVLTINGVDFASSAANTTILLSQMGETISPTCTVVSASYNQVVCNMLDGHVEGPLFAKVSAYGEMSSDWVEVATIVDDNRAIITPAPDNFITTTSTQLIINGHFDASINELDYLIRLSGPAASHPDDPVTCEILNNEDAVNATSITCTLSGTLLPGQLKASITYFPDYCSQRSSSGSPIVVATVLQAPWIEERKTKLSSAVTQLHIYGIFDTTIPPSQHLIILDTTTAVNDSVTCTIDDPAWLTPNRITCNVQGALAPGYNLTAIIVVYPDQPYSLRSNGGLGVQVAEIIAAPSIPPSSNKIDMNAEYFKLTGVFPNQNLYKFVITMTQSLTDPNAPSFACTVTERSLFYVVCKLQNATLNVGPLYAQVAFRKGVSDWVLVGSVSERLFGVPAVVTPSSGSVGIGAQITIAFTSQVGVDIEPDNCRVNNQSYSTGKISLVKDLYNDYKLVYTVGAGDPSWASNSLNVFCEFKDAWKNKYYLSSSDLQVNTLIGNTAAPAFSAFSISPLSGYATIGSTVQIGFTADSEVRVAPGADCTVNSRPVELTPLGFNRYAILYTVQQGDKGWTAGHLHFYCRLVNAAGNAATITHANLPSNTLRGDTDLPTISNIKVSPSSGYVKVGDQVRISFTASDGLVLGSTCTVNNQVINTLYRGANLEHYLLYTLLEGDSSWQPGRLSVVCVLRKASGNSVTLVLPAQGVQNQNQGDATPLSVRVTSLTSTHGNYARVGSEVKVEFIANKPVTLVDNNNNNNCLINNIPVRQIVYSGGGHYSFTYTVWEGDQSWDAGFLDLSCSVRDAAGNVAQLVLPANQLAGITTPPQILGAAVYATSDVVKNGGIVTISINASVAGLTSTRCLVNNVDIKNSLKVAPSVSPFTYNFTYIHMPSYAGWSKGNLSIDCTLEDQAGNVASATIFGAHNVEGKTDENPSFSQRMTPEAKKMFAISVPLIISGTIVLCLVAAVGTFLFMRSKYAKSGAAAANKIIKQLAQPKDEKYAEQVDEE